MWCESCSLDVGGAGKKVFVHASFLVLSLLWEDSRRSHWDDLTLLDDFVEGEKEQCPLHPDYTYLHHQGCDADDGCCQT